MIEKIKMFCDGYYGAASVQKSVFEKIDSKMLISKSNALVKYLCANDEEAEHLQQLGIDTNDIVCDWYKISLGEN